MIRDLVSRALDPDRALMRAMGAAIEAAAVRHALDRGIERYEPGKPLKLLLAGYQGTRNTGSDVRVQEMIRQLRAVLGEENLELSLLSIDPQLSLGYFRGVRQVRLPNFFPPLLFQEAPKQHGVIACEGSMFKSKFANALTTMMAGALGLASVEGKLAIGYGAEAGAMDAPLKRFVREHCRHALVVCRNQPSERILSAMGVRTAPGTDTAWTFEPSPRERGAEILRAAGWDGRKKVLIVCPVNPFYWPTRPDVIKAAAHELLGEFRFEHYRSIYFHEWSEESAQRYERYLAGLAEGVEAFVRDRGVFTVVAGSEQLDRDACERLAARLPDGAPVLVSDQLDMFDFVSVLRNASLMVSSRFHAIVTSMPAGVPSIGIATDERISNLMRDRGHEDFLLAVDAPDLGERVLSVLRKLERESQRVSNEVMRFVPGEIRKLGQMGIALADEAARVYAEFPRPNLPPSYEHHLPPLSPELERLMGEHA